MLIDGKLPGQEFVDRQRVAAAGLLKGEQAAANRGNDFGLTANDPPFGSGRGQVGNGKRTAVRPDDVFYPRAMGFCHGVLTNSQPLNSQVPTYAARLKICLSSRLQYELRLQYESLPGNASHARRREGRRAASGNGWVRSKAGR